MSSEKTVAAVSTAPGRGAVALIRITGEDAIEIGSKVFVPRTRMPFFAQEPNKTLYGAIRQGGDIIDDGIAVIYKAPHSYTGEDTVEIMCHGGTVATQLVLRAAFEAGAYPAGPGEFTKRAFINGKLKLSGAEAVMDVIDASSRASLRLAGKAGRDSLSGELGSIYDGMKGIAAAIYAYIDYPDEDLSDTSPETMRSQLTDINERLKRLADSYSVKKAVCDGIDTVICGKPNVGKSSLLNCFTGEDTAIVTDIAGTTRDVISHTVTCKDVLLNLCDTAGIHESDDAVESIGIDRALKKLDECSLALAVFDGSVALDADDEELIKILKDAKCTVIAVVNKTDCGVHEDAARLDDIFEHTVYLSAKTSDNIQELKDTVEKLFLNGGVDYSGPHIANERQLGEVLAARKGVANAMAAIDDGQSVDIASIDMTEAMEAIARIDGRAVGEDIVSEIFGKFCVGK